MTEPDENRDVNADCDALTRTVDLNETAIQAYLHMEGGGIGIAPEDLAVESVSVSVKRRWQGGLKFEMIEYHATGRAAVKPGQDHRLVLAALFKSISNAVEMAAIPKLESIGALKPIVSKALRLINPDLPIRADSNMRSDWLIGIDTGLHLKMGKVIQEARTLFWGNKEDE